MASPDLVKYFHKESDDGLIFVENLKVGDQYIFRNEIFIIEETAKKRYICKDIKNGKRYYFRNLAQVKPLKKEHE